MKPTAPASRSGNRSRISSARRGRLASAKPPGSAGGPKESRSELQPNPEGCALRLHTNGGVVVIEVCDQGCRLAFPRMDGAAHLAAWTSTARFIKALQEAGMDLFPGLDSSFTPTVAKVRWKYWIPLARAGGRWSGANLLCVWPHV